MAIQFSGLTGHINDIFVKPPTVFEATCFPYSESSTDTFPIMGKIFEKVFSKLMLPETTHVLHFLNNNV
jgi:hypothetical protein